MANWHKVLLIGKSKVTSQVTFTMQRSDREIDPYDKKILIALIQTKTEIGFNKLLKKLQKEGNFTKPTLISHLKRLQKEGYIKNRIDEGSKSPWKPSYYALNLEALNRYISNLEPNFKEYPFYQIVNQFDEDIAKLDFAQLSFEMMYFIFFGDLMILKLFIESLREKNKDNQELHVTKNILSVSLNLIMLQLTRLSSKMKDKDFQIVLAEFDKLIDRMHILHSS